MIQDTTSASLLLSVNTSLLKKTMDTSEALMATLINDAASQNPSVTVETPAQTSDPRSLDIYA